MSSRLARRIRRALRPPRQLRPTRAGWVYCAFVLGVGFASLNTGNNLLYLVFALLLAFLVLSGVFSEAALRGIEVERCLPRELFAEATAPVRLKLHNTQRRVPSFAVVVEDRVTRPSAGTLTAGRVFVLRVGPGETAERGYALTPEQRGPLEFEGFRISTRFPFGLFSKSMRVRQTARALVYPAIDPVRALRGQTAGAQAGEDAERDSGGGASVGGVREWAPGDAARHVHWRATARRGALLVRDRERDTRPDFEVRLHTREREAGDGFERSVREAASEVVAHLGAGFRVGLRTDQHEIAPASGASQRRRLLAYLAEVEPDPAAAEAAA